MSLRVLKFFSVRQFFFLIYCGQNYRSATFGAELCMGLKLGHLKMYTKNTREIFEMWCWLDEMDNIIRIDRAKKGNITKSEEGNE